MKNLSRIIYLVFVGFILSVFNTACSDNEDEPNIPDNPNSTVTDSLLYVQTIEKLTDYYVNEHGDSIRVVPVGRPLNPHDLTVLTVAVRDGKSARRRFLKLLPEELSKDLENKDGVIDISFHKAHIRFEPGDRAEYGMAYFDIPDLPELTKVEYISLDNAPLMSSDNKYAPRPCQIWEEIKTGEVYICIRELDWDYNYGLMIGIPVNASHQEKEWYNSLYSKYKYRYYSGNADDMDFKVLNEIFRVNFDIIQEQFNALKSILKYHPTVGRERMMMLLRNIGGEDISYESPRYYQVGNSTDGSCFYLSNGGVPRQSTNEDGVWYWSGFNIYYFKCGNHSADNKFVTWSEDFTVPPPPIGNPSHSFYFTLKNPQ